MKTNKMCAILGNLHRYEELLPLTASRPLSTLLFDCKYRLIDFNLSSIKNANINELFMVFNEGETQSVFDHIGGGKEWNLDGVQNRFFIYLYQDFLKDKKQGKAYFDRIIDYLEKSKSDHTVYMGSKIICNIDLRALLKIHQIQKNDVTVVYKRISKDKVCEKDLLFLLDKEGKFSDVAYADEMDMPDMVNLCTDIFIIKTDKLIEALKEEQASGDTFQLVKFLQKRTDFHHTSLYEYTGYLSNVYDVKSYYQANMDMLDFSKYTSLLYSNQKIFTKLKNEVPTYYAETSNVKNSHFASGCMIKGIVTDSLIARGTVVEPQAVVEKSILYANNVIEPEARIAYAILDKNVHVASGVNLIGTPENPVVIKKGIYVTEDVVRGQQE